MTEKQVRNSLIAVAKGWLGYNEEDGSHKKILKVYNDHKPLARNYKVQPKDEWCATFGSAVAIKAGLTDIIPTECGCEKQIELFKKLGRWQEDDKYIPNTAEYVYYDWQDNGSGDTKGWADHVGIVEKVVGNTIHVIEGNRNNAVSRRTLMVNGKYIRGYGLPDYASKATEKAEKEEVKVTKGFKVGDKVMFTGSLHYGNSGAKSVAKGCKAGMALVTAVKEGGAHPYHIKAVAGKGSTVYGWVNTGDVSAVTANSGKKYTVKAGDTLSKIAKKYGTTANKIASLNGIRNLNLIHTGQIIILP